MLGVDHASPCRTAPSSGDDSTDRPRRQVDPRRQRLACRRRPTAASSRTAPPRPRRYFGQQAGVVDADAAAQHLLRASGPTPSTPVAARPLPRSSAVFCAVGHQRRRPFSCSATLQHSSRLKQNTRRRRLRVRPRRPSPDSTNQLVEELRPDRRCRSAAPCAPCPRRVRSCGRGERSSQLMNSTALPTVADSEHQPDVLAGACSATAPRRCRAQGRRSCGTRPSPRRRRARSRTPPAGASSRLSRISATTTRTRALGLTRRLPVTSPTSSA